MRTLRAADLAARTAWFAAHPETSKALSTSASPVTNGLAAYQQELARKTALHSVQYCYKGNPVTTGSLAPWPTVAPAQTVLYANQATRTATEPDVSIVIVNSGTGPISALQLQHLSVQTLPGSSTTVTLRLNVPATVRKIKLTSKVPCKAVRSALTNSAALRSFFHKRREEGLASRLVVRPSYKLRNSKSA